MSKPWKERGWLTDDEINTLPVEELRDAIKTFRLKNPEVGIWVRLKQTAIIGAIVAAFFGGEYLNPASFLKSKANGDKKPLAATETAKSVIHDTDIAKLVTHEIIAVLSDYDRTMKEYVNERFVKKDAYNRELDRVGSQIEKHLNWHVQH
jgi:hypothetical protein